MGIMGGPALGADTPQGHANSLLDFVSGRYVYIYIYIYIYLCLYIYTCVCIYMYMIMYTYQDIPTRWPTVLLPYFVTTFIRQL